MQHFEESAGGVVLKSGEQGYNVLLILPKGTSKWRFPKGNLEENETPRGAAVREVEEEGGVKGRILAPLSNIGYTYRLHGKTIRKTVYFFLMEYLSGNPDNHDNEVSTAGFYPTQEALAMLAFDDERRLLGQGLELIKTDPVFSI